LSLQGAIASSLLHHGRVGWDRVRGYARAPTKPHGLGIYDRGGAHDLPRARGSCIPCSSGGIRCGVRDVLRAGIWCAITSIALVVVVLWLGTAALDPIGDLAYGSLCDLV
jgi:hypothetical protein